MSAIKIRIASGLKRFGLYPRSEVQALERELARTRERLRRRNEQLQQRNEQLRGGFQRKFQDTDAEPIWHRRVIGGMWEQLGRLQLSFLRERGMKPGHRLLDVGCGSLRGGVHFIPYLDPGHYYGVDRDERLLDAGRKEIEGANLQDRLPRLELMNDFGFERLDEEFDFALANSVFTHLTLNSIVRCLINVDRVLRTDGVFYASFFENPGDKISLEPVEQGDGFFSCCDQDPFHYTRDALEWACTGTGLTAGYVGGWDHPRRQVMMEFRRSDSPG